MHLHIHTTPCGTIAELQSDKIEISTVEEAVNLIANCLYQDAERIIVHERYMAPAFFDLKTRMTDDILQKVSNYRAT